MEMEVTPNSSTETYYTTKNSSQETSPHSRDRPDDILRQKLEKTPDGFEEEAFHDVISSILSMRHLTDARFIRFLFIAAPKKNVARKTLDLICAHVLSLPKTKQNVPKMIGCLHYLIALIKYDIIDSYDVQGQYPLYYTLLEYPPLETCVCELIYYTTTYDNIKPWLVEKIERMYSKGKGMQFRTLLQLFQRIRLNIVTVTNLPEVKNEIHSFGVMNQILKRTLEKVSVPENLQRHKNQTMVYPNFHLNQISVRSGAFKRSVRSYAQFDDLQEFLEHFVKGAYDMFETCFDSLLENRFNFVFIGVMGDGLDEQAKLYVKHIWKQIKEGAMDQKGIKTFLHNLHNICVVFGCDFFGMRRQLFKFMDNENNDFFYYSKEILQLSKMIIYPDFKTIFKKLLSPLYKNFIAAAQHKHFSIMSNILNALSKLLYNIYKSKSEPSNFLDATEDPMSDMDLSLTITAVQHFCKILINVAHGNFRAMSSVMSFYERLNAGEDLYKLNITNVIPPEISYAFIINPNAILLDRYATLIRDFTLLGQKYRIDATHDGLAEIGNQANELYVFLFRDPMTSKFFQQRVIVRNSNLFRKIIDSKVQRIYVFKHNLAFLHLTRLDSKGNFSKKAVVDWTRFNEKYVALMGLLSTIRTSREKKLR